MPANTSLDRVGRFSFFAIMAPGFYILIAVFLFASAWMEKMDKASVWKRMIAPWDQTALLWFLGFGVIFLSYIFGSLLRAIPVKTADSWTWNMRHPLSWKKKGDLYEKFPYPESLGAIGSLLPVNALAQIPGFLKSPIGAGKALSAKDKAEKAYGAHGFFNYLEDGAVHTIT